MNRPRDLESMEEAKVFAGSTGLLPVNVMKVRKTVCVGDKALVHLAIGFPYVVLVGTILEPFVFVFVLDPCLQAFV